MSMAMFVAAFLSSRRVATVCGYVIALIGMRHARTLCVVMWERAGCHCHDASSAVRAVRVRSVAAHGVHFA